VKTVKSLAPKSYHKVVQIRFREGDPARILYFANLFSLAHDTFEDFIQANGFTWKEWFKDSPYLVPIRHAECDYQAPFLPGEHYEIHVSVAQFRETSLQMKYVFMKGEKTHAVVKMVHAFLDGQTKQKTRVPESIKSRLVPFLEGSE